MTAFDLVFLALFLASIGMLLAAGFSLVRGRFRRALTLLATLALGSLLACGPFFPNSILLQGDGALRKTLNSSELIA